MTHSLTIEAYINVRSAPQGIQQQILFRGDDKGGGYDPYSLDVENLGNGPQIAFQINDAANDRPQVGAALPAFNEWIHVAGTLDDATGTMSIYVNGLQQNSIVTSVRPYAILDPTQNPGLGIGNVQSANYGEYFNGLIDEVRLSDQALRPDQFLDATPAPEPSSLTLAAVSGIWSLFWRRR